MTKSKKPFVVVTTNKDRRGVFSGFLESSEHTGTDDWTVTLSESRNCIRWSVATKGVFGLAAKGPQPGSRIGPATKRITIDGVTSIMEATDEALKVWRSEPWG